MTKFTKGSISPSRATLGTHQSIRKYLCIQPLHPDRKFAMNLDQLQGLATASTIRFSSPLQFDPVLWERIFLLC